MGVVSKGALRRRALETGRRYNWFDGSLSIPDAFECVLRSASSSRSPNHKASTKPPTSAVPILDALDAAASKVNTPTTPKLRLASDGNFARCLAEQFLERLSFESPRTSMKKPSTAIHASSPSKESPRARKPAEATRKTPQRTRLQGSSAHSPGKYSEWCAFPNAVTSEYAFRRHRVALANALFSHLDSRIFDGKLAAGVELTWSRTLNKTAGISRMKREQSCEGAKKTKNKTGRDDGGRRTVEIELSTKVVDRIDRLYETLAHEMCHAAQWLIDREHRVTHGKQFKVWAARCRQYDDELLIERCHSYEIKYRFLYQCESCDLVYGRHSASINTNAQVCGKCHGRLKLTTS
mmetsp:Transcript_15160/g.32491  ORF Transcript_15160/g.32491 Transcript_15160/m.32491 type:complete len:351 (+) Transcript_15160:29-1081(+)